MSKSEYAPRFEDVTFRASMRVHEKSVFLGHANATLVIPDGLGEDEDLRLTFYGLQVKLLGRDLRDRFDFAQIKGRGDRSGEWFPTAIPHSAETRVVLTASLFEHAEISAYAAIAREQLAKNAA